MTTTKKAMRCELRQYDKSGRKERAIYYLRKKFIDCKSKCTMVEKLFLCTCMGCKMTLAIHVILHYMADFKLDPLIYIYIYIYKPYLSSKIAR
jgi:hypothetical protein